jgi:teichoic acid transport system permease protein
VTTDTTSDAGTQEQVPHPLPAGQAPPPIGPPMTSGELRALAEQNGLQQMGVRPPLWDYIRGIFGRWAFVRVLATSTAYAKNQNNYLGQLWALLNPVLNAAVYVLVFGLLLRTDRGVENTVAFIVIGTFMFRFVEQSVSGGARSISGKVQLIRSLHFPRAVLPISTVLSLLATLIPAMVVMCTIVLLSGLLPAYPTVHITWYWLLLPPAVALMWLFNTGLAFVMARVVAITPDLDNVISFAMRFAMFGSGVIFPVNHYAERFPEHISSWLAPILEYQPIAVFLYLVRSSLTQEPNIQPDPWMWAWGAGWAIAFFVVGFLIFWRGEERYGRD